MPVMSLHSLYNEKDIVFEEKLLGTCTLRKLLGHRGNLPISDIMNIDDVLSLPPDMDWKSVARFMSKYDLINVPVVDEKQILLGSISVDDLLPWLLHDKKS